jgi:hypothetical protein
MKRKKHTTNQPTYSIKDCSVIIKPTIDAITINDNGIIPFLKLNLAKLILSIHSKI